MAQQSKQKRDRVSQNREKESENLGLLIKHRKRETKIDRERRAGE